MNKRILFILICVFIGIFLSEILLRHMAPHFPRSFSLRGLDDERNLVYQYDKFLGWFPIPESEGTYFGSKLIHYQHNKMGFRDVDHGEKKQKRIAFLGDSFVWGYDSEVEDRFTNQIQEEFPKYEVLNLGVSGYALDQYWLLLEKYFDILKPDAVFLILEHSDQYDETIIDYVYEAYYKPYFDIINDKLVLQGVPVPKSFTYLLMSNVLLKNSYVFRLLFRFSIYLAGRDRKVIVSEGANVLALRIIQEIKNFLQLKNAQLVVGFVDAMPEVQQFCDNLGLPIVDLIFELDDETMRFETSGNHWTVKGNRIVSQRIASVIRQMSF